MKNLQRHLLGLFLLAALLVGSPIVQSTGCAPTALGPACCCCSDSSVTSLCQCEPDIGCDCQFTPVTQAQSSEETRAFSLENWATVVAEADCQLPSRAGFAPPPLPELTSSRPRALALENRDIRGPPLS